MLLEAVVRRGWTSTISASRRVDVLSWVGASKGKNVLIKNMSRDDDAVGEKIETP